MSRACSIDAATAGLMSKVVGPVCEHEDQETGSLGVEFCGMLACLQVAALVHCYDAKRGAGCQVGSICAGICAGNVICILLWPHVAACTCCLP